MTPSKRFVLLGHPVAHSVSPAIHRAAYASLGVRHEYSLVDCADEGAVRAQLERLRVGEVLGANVTVPWKRLAFELADAADDSARDTGVANVLSRASDGSVLASNTDASALADEIAADCPHPGATVVLGGGGAAQAAVVACRGLGARSITVTSRGWRRGVPPAGWKRSDVFRTLGAEPVAWPEADDAGTLVLHDDDELSERLVRADVVIQATSAGMHGAAPGHAVSAWLPFRQMRAGALAYDVVYNPRCTPFLEQAAAAGLTARGGLGMLVRQAALAIRLWLGATPELAPLLAAADEALGAPAGS